MLTFIHKQIVTDLSSLTIALPQARILIAASGGKDSLCLLKLIKDLQQVYHWKVGIIHCDHQWRHDSHSSAQIIYRLAREFHFKFYLGINEAKLSEEFSTREWRYSMFFKIAAKYNYNLIVTAHNLNDRVETFLYNLCRGSLIDGISNVSFAKKISKNLFLYRPLINISQHEVYWLSRYFCLPVWSDFTNLAMKLKRNRIRQELLPYLRQYINPKVDKSIINVLDRITLQNEYLKSYVRLLYSRIVHPYLVALEINLFLQLQEVFQVSILEMIFKQLTLFNFQIANAQSILNFLDKKQNPPRSVLIIHQVILVQKTSYLYFCKNKHSNKKQHIF